MTSYATPGRGQIEAAKRIATRKAAGYIGPPAVTSPGKRVTIVAPCSPGFVGMTGTVLKDSGWLVTIALDPTDRTTMTRLAVGQQSVEEVAA